MLDGEADADKDDELRVAARKVLRAGRAKRPMLRKKRAPWLFIIVLLGIAAAAALALMLIATRS